ncbi:MAG: hypothetical protein R3307_09815 [Anaerolineales bacterium]|nr:hypothetical protein [Anaerolineales bacterium]
MTNSAKFPAWFNVLTALFFVSNLFVFGLATLFKPTLTFPDGGESAVFPIQFFAVRHIAMSIPLLHGLIRKDVKILKVMYTIFVVMSVLDIALLGIYGYNIPILGLIPFIANLPIWGKVFVGIGVFLVPITLALRYLKGYEE